MAKRVIVIGAGLGGMAAAALLAKKGYAVTVFEKNATPGGKMQRKTAKGYYFDTGPSLLTMPFILQRFFRECGEDSEDYLDLIKLDLLCRYIYPDGTVFDNYSDVELTLQQIKSFAPEDIKSYQNFLGYSAKLYERTAGTFLFNPLYSFSDLAGLSFMDFLKIDAFTTVSEKVDHHFSSSYLRKFFKRFTTYNGSSPFKAPATLNVIPYVELSQGGFYVNGGLYEIAKTLYQLATKSGVVFQFNSTVKKIHLQNRAVTSVELSDGSVHNTDFLFSNADATETVLNLLPADGVPERRRSRQKHVEPSGSGFVLLLGCKKQWSTLRHHTVFFSDNYEKEFDEIFNRKVLPEDPTIYIANTSCTNPGHAPHGASNLFVLVNAPYLTDYQNWEMTKDQYSSFLINKLEKKHLKGLRQSIEHQEVITPVDFQNNYDSNRGSIYGTSSNSRLSAFLRPRNKERFIKNLYLVGGSTHPGGGIPLVIQSAFNAVQLLSREKN